MVTVTHQKVCTICVVDYSVIIRQDRPEINIFKSPTQRALDGEMKRLRSTGLGVAKKKAS